MQGIIDAIAKRKRNNLLYHISKENIEIQ